MKIGNVVEATAGKEKNQVFVVVDMKDNFVYIADGDRRKKDSPKKKNAKHVKKISTLTFDVEELKINDNKVNASIRKFIKKVKGD